MGTFITILILIVCALLMALVLIQNSKGGGLASNFASSNQVMGVKRTADFLEKSTWTLAGALLLLCLLSAALGPKNESSGSQSEIEEYIQNNQPVTPPSGFQKNPEQK